MRGNTVASSIDPQWAWEPYVPSRSQPWDLKKVGHLYRRAAFGATWDELHAGLAAGPEKTIERLLEEGPGQEAFDQLTGRLAQSIIRANDGQQIRAWWLYRMLYSPSPLREKLTLFWHNHFATSNAKVRNAGFMLGQYQLLRRHVLGSFRTLLLEMSKDPAMMVWLDTSLSKKGKPNENYARELMDLFSLGIGHYTEVDIREAARAFTGWEIKQGKAVFNARQHDDGDKTVLGQKGNWQGADVVRICLEQKSAPYFLLEKLFRFLVNETTPATKELLAPLARQFHDSDYDFGALVKRILRSNFFFSADAYRARIKSPVEFVVGIVRALEGHVGTAALARATEELGQNLFYPPTVKGWPGGPSWLNGQTLLFRQNLALALTSTEDSRFGRRTDPARLAHQHGRETDAQVLDLFLGLFLQDDLAETERRQLTQYQARAHNENVPVYWTSEDAAAHRVRSLCHLVLTLPEFQLD